MKLARVAVKALALLVFTIRYILSWIKTLLILALFLEGCEDEKRSEENPSFGYPKTCQECWQTEVKKKS